MLVRATRRSAGCDLPTPHAIELKHMEPVWVDTGERLRLDDDTCALVLPRSGLARQHGITLINSPGLIDPDYPGTVHVGLIKLTRGTVTLARGTRIAQILVVHYQRYPWALTQLNRRNGGFGSTGL